MFLFCSISKNIISGGRATTANTKNNKKKRTKDELFGDDGGFCRN